MHHHSPNKSPPAPTPPLPTLTANNAYNMTSVNALVRFLHAAAGFPVKSMWLVSIRAGNYATRPGLTYENAKTYHPTTAGTIKGHMTQTLQSVLSTKLKATPYKTTRAVSPLSSDIPAKTSKKIYVVVEPVIKLYNDDMGRFSIHCCSGHHYIMLTFHCDINAIPIEPFQSHHDLHRIASYSRIMTRLRKRGHAVYLQVLDNKASKEYR